MAETKNVDWRAIRAEYETTDVSDAALAKRWGFRSATTIARRRQVEGWTRDVEAVAANLVTKAVAGTARDPRRRRPDAHTQPGAHTPPLEQTPAAAAQKTAGVGKKTPARTSETAPAAPTPPTHTPARTGWDQSEADKLETAKDLATIRAEAIADQLATADDMVQTGKAWLQSLMALASSPCAEPIWPEPFHIARARIAAVSDKDTISSVMKAVASLLTEGVRIQREALGMSLSGKADPAGGDQVRPGHRPEDVLVLLDPATLERLGQAAAKLSLQRPTIEGQVADVRKL